ncbi:MFS transporter [Delftia acidovorans]|uniref:MFS transporter n=1 Tax=Delftia acidovorans TaxID=80866 RepID=UPI0030165D8D
MQTHLPDRLPPGILLPYLLVAMVLALAYGATFLVADGLREAGFEASRAGAVVGTGTVATLTGALLAGKWAERWGLLPLVAAAAVAMALAMACFSAMGRAGMGPAYAAGLLLGLGWAVFYMLAPIQIIHCLRPAARLQAFTLLSGSQMLGMGLAAPLGHWLARQFGGVFFAFAAYGVLCLLAAGSALLVSRRLARQPQLPMKAVALSMPAVVAVLRSRAAMPVVLMGLSACSFAGLSTFQSLYAQARGLTPDIFFITFTVTTVVLRFTVAPWIGRLPLGRLALCLFVLTVFAITLLIVNMGSPVLYALASLLFAVGYGLTYSTLNAMVVNMAESLEISIPVASQVFTLGYFAGAFGFPYVAGALIASFSIDAVFFMMLALVGVNVVMAGTVPPLRRG